LKNVLHTIEVVHLVRNDPTTAAAMYHGRGLSNFKLMQVIVTQSTVTAVCTQLHTSYVLLISIVSALLYCAVYGID
jgi:hypothetical protein